jgi:predicted ATP-grasp superfamily ATP-dependent carboligase
LLGGRDNALSVARSLGGAGVRVYALNWPFRTVRFSRHCHWIPTPAHGGGPEAWQSFLLGEASESLRGSVLLACEDAAIEILVRHEAALARKFLLDESDARLRSLFLDKLSTYEAAREAGVATPRYWRVDSSSDLQAIADDLVFPVLVKPRRQPEFVRQFPGRKYLLAEDLDSLRARFGDVSSRAIDVVLTEFVPGGDDRLCSYYTYMVESGRPLCHFTKRIRRRYPAHMGEGCYHVTAWIPEVRDVALALFRHVGLRGLGNAEFKRDPRDGRLKLIEVNARFTGCDALLVASGVDFAAITYGRLTGRSPAAPTSFAVGKTQWRPVEDFLAFLELRRRGELGVRDWLRECLRPHVLPAFAWSDPLPSWAAIVAQAARLLARPWRRWRGRTGAAATAVESVRRAVRPTDGARRGRSAQARGAERAASSATRSSNVQ